MSTDLSCFHPGACSLSAFSPLVLSLPWHLPLCLQTLPDGKRQGKPAAFPHLFPTQTLGPWRRGCPWMNLSLFRAPLGPDPPASARGSPHLTPQKDARARWGPAPRLRPRVSLLQPLEPTTASPQLKTRVPSLTVVPSAVWQGSPGLILRGGSPGHQLPRCFQLPTAAWTRRL